MARFSPSSAAIIVARGTPDTDIPMTVSIPSSSSFAASKLASIMDEMPPRSVEFELTVVQSICTSFGAAMPAFPCVRSQVTVSTERLSSSAIWPEE
jgi:hypothetical protein